MLINLRNALMSGKRLPYDAEVEYLESTGTQWIDTGINPQSSTTWSADIVCLPKSGVVYMSLTGYSYNTQGIQSVGISRQKWSQTSLPVDYANPTLVHADQNGQFFNGIQGNSNNIGRGLLYLFNRTHSSRQFPWVGKIYSAKIRVESILVRDYIPVRVGTVGYLYDRVSGKLFGNARSGDFVLGPDKAASKTGGYKHQCVRRSYRRSLRPSTRFRLPSVALAKDGWRRTPLWKEVA